MTECSLYSQSDSINILTRFFGKNENNSKYKAVLEVNEDICFGENRWLTVGEITLYPGENESGDIEEYYPVEQALRLGSYEWKVPRFEELLSESISLILNNVDDDKREKEKTRIESKTQAALKAVAHIAVRCGLAHPVFDADSFINMPFNSPTTIVADTSAVLQGGLDFATRFLCPMARIKIPAIVHMEIVNSVERYLSQRREKIKKINKGLALSDHVKSQGGYRVLLRLELQTDTEIERPRLGADPLRGIVQPDSDAEDTSLGLQRIVKSFADRLILETAIQHRDRLSPNHQVMVMLLTSDQGLARMTLSEGMEPLFFDTNYFQHIFGSTLTGTCFSPFIATPTYERLYFVPLTELLWEFAVTFGASRLVSQDKESFVEVRAMGNTLSWSPFHAKDDLLWLRWENIDTKRVEQPGVVQDNFHEDFKETCKESQVQTSVKEAAIPLKGSYKFSVSSMLLLIHAFYEKEVLTDDGGIAVVGVKTIGNFRKYRNFLRSGELIRSNESGFSKTDRLTALWNALCQRDYGEIKNSLYYVPSFKGFIDELRDSYPSNAQDISSVISAVFPTYCTLAELSCAGLNIADEGMYKTLNEPPLKEFANIAVNLFNEIAKGEKYILTGQWLEALARQYSIHPVVAKNRLNEARQAGLLERYTEGSTPETQFEKHTMNYLKLVNNMPVVEKINLYYGDFLIPERASVSIRIEGKNK